MLRISPAVITALVISIAVLGRCPTSDWFTFIWSLSAQTLVSPGRRSAGPRRAIVSGYFFVFFVSGMDGLVPAIETGKDSAVTCYTAPAASTSYTAICRSGDRSSPASTQRGVTSGALNYLSNNVRTLKRNRCE